MEAKPPITDSPWFWVVLFSGMALVALVAMGPKYGGRQSRIELQYQARERVAAEYSRGTAGQASSDTEVDRTAGQTSSGTRVEGSRRDGRRNFASRDKTLIPLWPLGVLIGAVLLVASVMLVRERLRLNASGSSTGGSRVA